MVHDYYRDRTYPYGPTNIPPYNPYPQNDTKIIIKESAWDEEAVRLLKEAIELLKKVDKKLGDKDCADPEKMKWLQEIEERLNKLKNAESGHPPK